MADRETILQPPAQYSQKASQFQNVSFKNDDQSITKTYVNKRFLGMVKWLGAPDPKPNFTIARDRITKGTGLWILQHPSFLEWKTNGHILWIQGKAGSGKTFLCTMMIESIRKETLQFIYYYFDTRDSKKCHHAGFMSSVFLQLISGMDENDVLKDFYGKSQEGRIPMKPDDLESIILDTIKSFQSTLYIVIDAMDECADPQRTMGFLQKILSLGNIFVLVTSRYQNTIQFSKAIWEIAISDRNVNPDIETHINHVLMGFEHLSDSLKADIKDVLVKGANGQIQWADCQLTVLKSFATPKAIKRALKSLPETLEETYTQALQRTSPYHQEDAKHILEWIIYSLDPVTTDMIREVLAIDIDEKTFVEEDRPSDMEIELHRVLDQTLLVVTTGQVQLAHPTVKDFLIGENIKHSAVNYFYMNDDLAQQFITKCCLIYILHFGKDVNNQINKRLCPLAMYAAENWMNHARELDNDDVHNLCLDVLDPESGPYINWLHLYQPDETWENQGLKLLKPASPVYYASVMGMKYLIESLLKDKSVLETVGGEYGYPLHAAAGFGHEQIVDMILNKGTSINTIYDDFYGGTALTLASKHGHEAIARLLLSRGADINLIGGHYGTALQAACSTGNLAIAELLLGKGADINIVGGHYGTALQAACNGGHLTIVRLLLDNGADTNLVDGYCGTALQAACNRRNLPIVECLLNIGAEVNLIGGYYGTALHAALVSEDLVIADLLVESGADINAIDPEYHSGGTPLNASADSGFLSSVRFLLDKGADVNIVYDGFLGTALQAAAYRGHTSIVQLLLSHGADVNVIGGYFGTALNLAAHRGHEEIVKMLLDEGAEVNALSEDYETALDIAFQGGHESIIQLLLNNGGERFGFFTWMVQNRDQITMFDEL